jgi:nickel-dependent lactate racemase
LKGVAPKDVEFVVATGIHRPHKEIENVEVFSEELVQKYHFSSHDCDHDLVDIGKLSDGTHFAINRKVFEANIIIGTGLIGLHYFAGFSGGRKSILPGVSGRDTITQCHSKMTDPRAKSGELIEILSTR